ncbi:hypothetical protein [Bradyrhizobium icense]|uniref:Uncharacterized protein n=1 Tax=Bradyrhizobium icense TaxID=1274631 RepID=A0A1B1UPF2_9BRAD|nr:hypothetical protein [Bradyrhizobium icense]ANW04578.1 hypothetical protein LMTR13_35075 [Bradyrhizobium icense]
MPDRIGRLIKLFGTQRGSVGLVVSLLAIAPDAGWAQAAPQPSLGLQSPAQQPVPSQPERQQTEPQQAPRQENPGLINEIGKLFEKSKSLLPPLKSPSETIDDFNAGAKGAGESLSNIAKPSIMVSGRAACLVAANGAPDCKAGADRLCQSKGYKEGKSLDTDAAEKCSPKVFLPGYKRQSGDCKTENYVTRALCQ